MTTSRHLTHPIPRLKVLCFVSTPASMHPRTLKLNCKSKIQVEQIDISFKSLNRGAQFVFHSCSTLVRSRDFRNEAIACGCETAAFKQVAASRIKAEHPLCLFCTFTHFHQLSHFFTLLGFQTFKHSLFQTSWLPGGLRPNTFMHFLVKHMSFTLLGFKT